MRISLICEHVSLGEGKSSDSLILISLIFNSYFLLLNKVSYLYHCCLFVHKVIDAYIACKIFFQAVSLLHFANRHTQVHYLYFPQNFFFTSLVR